MVARVVARVEVLLLFVFLALLPATVLAFNPPDPNSPGHHYGEYLHNKHLQTTAPPGGGNNGNNGGGGGIQNSFGGLKSGTQGQNEGGALPTFQFQPIGLGVPALLAASNVGKDAWWVVILLASFIAANVVLAVIYGSRGGNYVVRRVLRFIPATA